MWLHNPLPYFAKYPEADILATSDGTAPTHDDGGLEDPQIIGRHDLNIGQSLCLQALACSVNSHSGLICGLGYFEDSVAGLLATKTELLFALETESILLQTLCV